MRRKAAAAEHGTMARYSRGCRCELCRAAKASGRLPQERRELRALLADPGDPRHGTTTGYRVGCRCERCREAKSEAKARYLDEKRLDRLVGAGEGGRMKSYTARIVKTYQKEVKVEATNDREALRFASSKIMQGGSQDEILVKSEIFIEPAAKGEGSGQ
ncbi:hypothetical protein [Raoultibacter timonensis]|uniref:Uncharacterized protein n=1 Tax=Raoultibacter timonensis TaxID=1907662 RepID=A0ABN6MCF5_9ACTN|nr:hypothetical protein [Raoultibacter timonensis]BDE94874.1 hypothetical protein CE91St30_02070 [Raoultibacter timonensis]BDF49477.1 hypothetical protein CE91St31_02070 [Raoultibacter timonensis]